MLEKCRVAACEHIADNDVLYSQLNTALFA
jgi:hypothetical protein